MKSFTSLFLFLFTILAASGEEPLNELESAFVAMLKNATLQGSWVPVKEGSIGTEKDDSYDVVRARKVKGDRWEIISRTKYRGKEIEFPFPVILKWAGDTAVMILDEIPNARGKKYSARVMFHNDRYAGSWWGENQPGGLLSGTISRKDP